MFQPPPQRALHEGTTTPGWLSVLSPVANWERSSQQDHGVVPRYLPGENTNEIRWLLWAARKRSRVQGATTRDREI